MALSSGQRLGPYEVLSPIGAGGMGEVYRARDPRLGREIAIKVLPAELASDPERLKRFEREARAASALSHPNIITVYDVGTADSVSYMAIELIDGTTLHDLLLPGPLPMRKLLVIAAQIADGLAAAHEAGIIHRDLKPRNVMVSRAGFVKILDFGLAKVQPAPAAGDSGSQTQPAETTAGVILGTADYMSPEQARGMPLDFRSDQFSFGAVLYEMAAGRRAFGRATLADTISAILQQEPAPIVQLRPDAPAPLRWIIERCLAKSASDRYASTRDLARDLQTLKEHLTDVSGEVQIPAAPPKRRRRAIAVGIALVTLAVAGIAFALFRESRGRMRADFRRLTFRNGIVSRALFVPNSNSILYTASWDGQPSRTYVTLQESSGRDRPLEAEVQLPMAYSRDGSQVLVLLGRSAASLNPQGTLAWWPALGGRSRRILDGAGWADWAEEGRFFAVVHDLGAERALEIRDASGGLNRTVFRTTGAIAYVRISPDEKRVAFIHHPSTRYDAGEIVAARVDGSGSRSLTHRFQTCAGLDWNRRTGEIWFTGSVTSDYSSLLWAVTPAGRMRTVYSFPEFLVLQRIADAGDRLLLTSSDQRASLTIQRPGELPRDLSWLGWSVPFDISPDGKSVLFIDGGTTEKSSGMFTRSLDGEGTVRLGEGEPGRFSPDGRWVVGLTSPVSGPQQIVLVPVDAGKPRQLTFTESDNFAPSFAGPNTILFSRSGEAGRTIWRVSPDGTGARSLGVRDCDAPVGSPAGDEFLCFGGESRGSLVVHSLNEPRKSRRLYESPDGTALLYARWNLTSDRVLAVARDGRLLVLDAATGALVKSEPPPPEPEPERSLLSAACSADGAVRAYSIIRTSSALYLGTGL